LLLAVAAAADPFDPKREHLVQQGFDDDACARYVESLALLKEALQADPANVPALERATALLERVGTALELQPLVAKALAATTEEGPRRGALLGLAGHLALLDLYQTDFWVFDNGEVVRRVDAQALQRIANAAAMLREAVRLCPTDARARDDLADVLEMAGDEATRAEIERLRQEAGALRLPALDRPGLPPLAVAEAARLRKEAEDLEQRSPPEHGTALPLRRQALVLDFCAGTIPFEYDPALYGPVSLLAPEGVVVRSLTRTFRKVDGTTGGVPPTYHPAPPAQRVKLAGSLGGEPGSGAGACLLKLLATAREKDAVADAAKEALLRGKHEAVRRHLPALLAAVVYAPDPEYPPLGQRLLVESAAALGVEAAAPVLAVLLPLDEDPVEPRGVAAALGVLGGPAHAEPLLKVAQDPGRDVYFRREAILALGRLAPDRLGDVPAEPYLEIALAAARHRAAPAEAHLGRVLQGLGRPHEADDAARYLADLGAREALPDLERFLAEHPDHYASQAVQRAAVDLRGR
jgi:tetratricopeptide (TPR) repeat protein